LLGGAVIDSLGNFGYLNDLWEYQLPVAVAPTFSVTAGIYTTAQTVTISDATAGAAIYYTTNGAAPTTSSTLYSSAITVSATETLEAIATASGYSTSAVATAAYTITPPAATPTFSPAAGTYTSTQSVTISDSTTGATIYYTTDGITTPTTSWDKYTGAITVSATETIQAIAVASGYSNSAVASATYTIPPDFNVAINPASISVQAGQSGTTTITVTDVGGFNGNVAFACSGLPEGNTCSFSMLTVPTPAGVSYSTLTVTTTATTASIYSNGRPLLPGSVLAVGLFCYGWKKRRRLQMLLLLTVSVAGLSLLNGCGGGSSAVSTPPSVSSTVTVTAASGSLSNTTTFTLTVN
jgi:hypothetical protein